MTKRFAGITLLLIFLIFPFHLMVGQKLQNISVDPQSGTTITGIRLDGNISVPLKNKLSLFSFRVNDQEYFSSSASGRTENKTYLLDFPNGIAASIRVIDSIRNVHLTLTFHNNRSDSVSISHVLPLGYSSSAYVIFANQEEDNNTPVFYAPDYVPVSVQLPAGEESMGFISFPVNDEISLAGLARRKKVFNGNANIYESVIASGGSVTFSIYLNAHEGVWQEGLSYIFNEQKAYGIPEFDNALYEQESTEWLDHAYLSVLQFAWDKQFYNHSTDSYAFEKFLEYGRQTFGGFDMYTLWPGWPRLGLDERSQWEIYESLPGGFEKLSSLSNDAEKLNTNFFVTYYPWDHPLQKESDVLPLSALIEKTDARGVFVDSRSSAPEELRQTLDSIDKGIVIYPEGMPNPSQMQYIRAGRIHSAIEYQPVLNINKLIKTDFSIFRVLMVGDMRLHREIAISFFNGYGNELNYFSPARPSWLDEEYAYLAKLTRHLRENSGAFTYGKLTPLIPSIADSLWVNKWEHDEKTLYTFFSLKSSGHSAPLFEVAFSEQHHFVDILNHTPANITNVGGRAMVGTPVDGYPKQWTDTRREGVAGAIARFPVLINAILDEDSLHIYARGGTELKIWTESPAYNKVPVIFETFPVHIDILETLNQINGKFIIQLFKENELVDERILTREQGVPVLVSHVEETAPASKAPAGMVEIPYGSFIYESTNNRGYVQYPEVKQPAFISFDRFFMDTYPVTNAEFEAFLNSSRYTPKDETNFLKHWQNGEIPTGQENYPVVYVSLEDARAYAEWIGKRLPTESEWQYAAQSDDGRVWPWGDEFHATKCNNGFGRLTPVNAFPKGESPFGVRDMVGNVWQLTNDEYFNGSYYFSMIRGGSFHKPGDNLWYIEGGPQPVNHRQILLKVSSGFERHSTIGFRCVKDAAD